MQHNIPEIVLFNLDLQILFLRCWIPDSGFWIPDSVLTLFLKKFETSVYF